MAKLTFKKKDLATSPEEVKVTSSQVLDLLSKINAAYKTPVIRTASELPNVFKIPLGNPAFDYVTGGGLPVNRFIEFIGLEASTKTYHALLAAKEFQKVDWGSHTKDTPPTPNGIRKVSYKTVPTKDGSLVKLPEKIIPTRRGATPVLKHVAYVDFEHTFDLRWAEYLGVDVDGLLYVCPDSASQGVDIVDTLLSDETISLVIIDSIHAVGSDAETEASMENEQMASNARFWNKAFRKFQSALNRNPGIATTCLVINSYSTKVGFVMGNPLTPKNGIGLKHAKALSVSFTALKTISEKVEGVDTVIGRNVKLETLKSKVGEPFRESSFFFYSTDAGDHKKGTLDADMALLDLGVKFGIVERKGAFYNYGGHKSQGIENFKNDLQTTGLLENLRDEVYQKF